MTWAEIGAEVGMSPQLARYYVGQLAPELVNVAPAKPGPKPHTGGAPENLYNLKPRPIPAWQPPRTGSDSGFIRPIPLSRLTGARA